MEKFGLAKRSTTSKSSANASRGASQSTSVATALSAAIATATAASNPAIPPNAATTSASLHRRRSGSSNSLGSASTSAVACSSFAPAATPSTSAAADVTADDDVRRGSASSPGGQAAFLNKVRQASDAVSSGDFRRAVEAYGEAIQLDPSNHILYTNRAAALFKLALFADSVKDARSARDLNPKWAKAYLREGVALQQLGHHGDALAAFAAGLAQEPSNSHLLSGLTDTALKSPLKDKFQATFQQLECLRLGRSPFVLMAVVGQELLAATHYSAAVSVLESALQVGTPSLKLRGSVFSALASAHWGLGALDKAIYHMQQDLAVAKSLGDQEGECRAYGNLGSAYFSKGQYKESLTHHRFQLVLAMRLRHRQTAAAALSSLGHVYTAVGDYPNALASHKQCVLLLKQSNDQLNEAREIGNVGAVYLAMGNFASAVECHQEHLKMARSLRSAVEEARAYSNLGSAYHYRRLYDKALGFHKEVLRIAEERGDKVLEARAYAGLGHAARCAADLPQAKHYHEKQLDNALQTKDRVAEGRACANLGIIFHQLGEHDAALKLHRKHLELARALGDKGSQGRALGNMGNAHSALGKYQQAVKFHIQALQISQQVHDCHSQGSTHGNLAVAYQALGAHDKALQHYLSHMALARELKDGPSEARALCNLGNFHCARGDYAAAVPFYDQYLALSRDLKDVEGESKACFNLGYAHFSLGNFPEAVRSYQQDLGLARDRKDRLAVARAYCNLGLAHKALGSLPEALECQQKCLRLMEALRNVQGKFRALGNIGEIMLKMGDTGEAVKVHGQQVRLAQQSEDQELLATAKGALGHAHRLLGQHDRALACHTQELTIRQEMADLRGECRAHGHLGHVHTSLGNYLAALKCYQEMLERARQLGCHALEGQAAGNLGISKMNLGQLEDAIGFFEQQLAMLEQQAGAATLSEKARAFANLGDCYEALGDFEEAVKWHEQCLAMAQQLGSLPLQDKAYRGLGNAHKAVGNLQQALVSFEKRLYVAHQLNSCPARASAYGELGCLHSLLGNFEQAVSCLEQQLQIAREMGDQECESDAACGLGGVYQQMGEYDTALKYHRMDLHIAQTIRSNVRQCRAYGNLGLSHESLGNYEEAVKYQEQHLSIAAEMSDKVAKTLAYSSLGRVHHALGRHRQAVQYLQQGLAIAEQQRRREDEAKIRHRLGLALLGCGLLEDCQRQLHVAADLFESIRRESQCSSDYKLSLFDLQTACYQALQKVLVALGRHQEALVVAERACTRAFIDLLLERQAGSAGLFNGTTMDLNPVTIEQMTATVARQKALVLCFSVAAGSLYSWLLTPAAGVVKFHELGLHELEADVEGADTQSLLSISSASVLDQCVGQVREAMGIESHIATTSTGLRSGRPHLPEPSDCESEAEGEALQQQLEAMGGRLNVDGDRSGFLAMVSRGHTLNSSTLSLGSVLSLASSKSGGQGPGVGAATATTTTTTTTTAGMQRAPSLKRLNSTSSTSSGKSPLSLLYNCLIAPMEETIAALTEGPGEPADLVLVLQGDLYLIPFLMLRGDQGQPFLFERFNLIIVPSVSALHSASKGDGSSRPVIESSGALVVGNPQLTPTVAQHWHLKEIPGAEYEARIVGELLTCRPLIGPEATKGAVLHQIEQVEVIHFAAHISWRLSSIVLSPCDFPSPGAAGGASGHHRHHPQHHFSLLDSDDSASDVSGLGSPALSEYLLTAADILNLKLHAKLVVLNSGYTDDRAGRVNTDGVVGLTRALLSAGAQCVLFSLWPVPDSASKLLMRTLYGALQDGQPVTKALSKAVKTVQSTKQFSHPANWGGWVLVGQDVQLASKVALMGHALGQILQASTSSRETIRVLLHLMEKSLQRIQQGARNPMYTTVQSIENKVGAGPGWKELLYSVGFRFEPATAGLPPVVFFPQSNPSDRLTQASASLQAILGLPPSCVTALAKFIANQAVGEALIQGMREILSKLSAKEGGIDMLFNVGLWHVSGCHEFLASLGLDLVAVGAENVTLRLSKQAVRRHLQFALQTLVAVFNTQDAPRTLSLDSSSSMESLSSCHSLSGSPSSTSLSSPTPGTLSPVGRGRRSLFNPAEMERMRQSQRQQLLKAGELMSSSPSPTTSSSPRSPLLQDPALCLSHQNRIRSLYGSSSSTPTEGTATPEGERQPPPLSSSSQDDSDSAPSGEATLLLRHHHQQQEQQRRQSVLRSASSDSVSGLKSVKFAEDLVMEQLFDPHPEARSETESEDESGGHEGGRTASQLRQHFERLSVTSQPSPSAPSIDLPRQPAHRAKQEPELYDESVKSDKDDGEGGTDKMDPENIALKVLADVAPQRAEVERMQRHSAALSQDHSRRLRQQAAAASAAAVASPMPSGVLESRTIHLTARQPPEPLPRSHPSVYHLKGRAAAAASSNVTVNSKVTPPPPYPTPPSYCRHSPSPTGLMRGSSGGRGSLGRVGLQSGENSISSDNSEGADSNLQSSVSSGYHSENSAGLGVPGTAGSSASEAGPGVVVRPVVMVPSSVADRYLSTREFVNHSAAGAFAKTNIPQVAEIGTTSFASASSSPFVKPAVAKPPSPLVRTSALTQSRPESTNSLSSQYSTSSSSARSVIYRPLGPALGSKVAGLSASPRSPDSPLTSFTSPSFPSAGMLQGEKAGGSLSDRSDESRLTFGEDDNGVRRRVRAGEASRMRSAARYSADDVSSTYSSSDGETLDGRHEEELRAASVGVFSRVRMAADRRSMDPRVGPALGQSSHTPHHHHHPGLTDSVNGDRDVNQSQGGDLVFSSSAPPALPPRQPLSGKGGRASPLVNAAVGPRPDFIPPAHGGRSNSDSGNSQLPFPVTLDREISFSSSFQSTPRRGEGAVSREELERNGTEPTSRSYSGPGQPISAARKTVAEVGGSHLAHPDPLGSWTRRPSLESNPNIAAASRQTSAPFFLDKDRRALAKGAILQSSKC